MTQAAVHLVSRELVIEDKIQLNEKQGIEKEVCQERHASRNCIGYWYWKRGYAMSPQRRISTNLFILTAEKRKEKN